MTNKIENTRPEHLNEKRKVLNARKKILYKTLTIENYIKTYNSDLNIKNTVLTKFQQVFGFTRGLELLNRSKNSYDLILQFDSRDMENFMNHF